MLHLKCNFIKIIIKTTLISPVNRTRTITKYHKIKIIKLIIKDLNKYKVKISNKICHKNILKNFKIIKIKTNKIWKTFRICKENYMMFHKFKSHIHNQFNNNNNFNSRIKMNLILIRILCKCNKINNKLKQCRCI